MSVISGFHHVALTVRDLATSAEWYRTVLGLEELFREDGEQRQAVIFGFPGGGHAVGLDLTAPELGAVEIVAG